MTQSRTHFWTKAGREMRKDARRQRRIDRADARRRHGKRPLRQVARDLLVDSALLVAVACVVYGMAQMYGPAGWITAGLLLAGLVWLHEMGGRPPRS